eukprot:6361096-Alexandrium_andersonii.AAC.1
MSASLVGSEMCIRDSSTAIGRTAHAHRHQCERAAYALVPRMHANAAYICLLYTSDAADDM